MLGIAMDEEGWDVVKPYLGTIGLNYRVILGNEPVADLYGGIDALPTTFVLDRQGRIAASHVGPISKNDYEDEIKGLL